ncbi:MAG: CBS domain-containing protein, partial [Thermoplasmata archaeon]
VFGGVASMEAVPREPGQEWRMAFAGPATSLAMGGAAYAAMLSMDALDDGSAMVAGTIILLGILGFYNVLLAGFNLIPAFPMDGGRLLRAFFASRMPYLEATKRAAKIGRYFAIGMGVVGIFTNFWLIVIALFVYIGATEEEQATTISETLHGMTVRQLMTDAVQVVHPDTTVVQLQDLILMTKHKGFPVVDRGLVGIVTQVDANKIPREQLQFAKVGDIMTRDVATVPPDMDAAKALTILTEKRIGRLPVVDDDKLVGIVTKTDFLRAVEVMTARREMALWVQQYPRQPPQPPVPPSPPTASS